MIFVYNVNKLEKASWLAEVRQRQYYSITHTILTDSLTDLLEVCWCGCLCVDVYVCLRKQSVCKMFTVLFFSIAVISCACGYLCVRTYALGTRMLKCVCVYGTDVKSLSVFFSPLLSSSPCRGHNTYLHFIHHREPQIETQTVDYLGSVFHCDKSSDYAPS